MYLQLLNYLSYFFTILFFGFLFYVMDWQTIKKLWQNAVAKVQIPKMIKKAESEGKRPFYFNNGKTIIYAKTPEQAKYDYRKLREKGRKN